MFRASICVVALALAGVPAGPVAPSAFPSPAQEYESYGVFCAGGRVEVDARSEEQMRRNRGACQFARFATRSDAEAFAKKNFGGVGASCACR